MHIFSLLALEEQNEELQATMLTNQATMLTNGVEQGRHLLNGTLNSLAQELEEMSQAQVCIWVHLLRRLLPLLV